MSKNELTIKQALFVQNYLSTLNATQSAILAGYSKKTAYSIGQENLKKPDIRAAIELARQGIEARLVVDRNRVLLELARLAIGEKRDSVKLNALKLLGDHYGLFDGPKSIDAEPANEAQLALDERLSTALSKVEPNGPGLSTSGTKDPV